MDEGLLVAPGKGRKASKKGGRGGGGLAARGRERELKREERTLGFGVD